MNYSKERYHTIYRNARYILVAMLTTIANVHSISVNAQQMLWQFESIRDEIDPLFKVSNQIMFEGNPTLMLSGGNKEYVNGSWTKTFDVQAGKYYEFITHFQSESVDDVDRSVLASLTWINMQGERDGFIEFPGLAARKEQGVWQEIKQVYQVPAGIAKVKVNLIYRWDMDGSVYFGGTALKKADAPAPRLVNVAVVHYRPRNTANVAENLELFTQYVDQAGDMNADIVCLPEGITVVGNGKTYLEASEPVPGATTRLLGTLAKKHEMYIVAGLLEKDGEVLYNSAVLMDRNGQLAGKYRKVSLPREEIEGGITPGSDFPVFDTDFGRIGMMICWDVFFPEPARMLALKGAEIVFMPIWGGNLTLSKARAIENQVYLVSSTYDMKSGVFDKTGALVVEGTEADPVVMTTIDLNQREMWEWLGEFRNRIRREMPDKKSISY